MKKILMVLALTAFAAPGAFACQVSSSKIKGQLAGNDPKNNICYILVDLEEVHHTPHCGLNGLKVGKQVKLKTDLTERQCPDDEQTVEGQVVSLGGELLFRGKLPKRGGDEEEEADTGPRPR